METIMKAALTCAGLVLASLSSSLLATPALSQGMSRPDGFTCSCYADIDKPIRMPGGGMSYICPPGPGVMRANMPQRSFIRGGETIIASCEIEMTSPNDSTIPILRDSSVSDDDEDTSRTQR
jgi:hypothetical protein